MSVLTIPAVGDHTATLIMIHGLGGNGAGWSWLADHLRQKKQFANVKFIFPSAPSIPFSPAGGQKMPGWFDIVRAQGTTPFTDRRADQDEIGVLRSNDYFQELIKSEVVAGIPASRIIIGGFSQGGAMSIFSGITAKEKLGGIFGLSCFLPMHLTLDERLPKDNPNLNTPIFMGHGDRDNVLRLEWAQTSLDILKKLGWNVEFKIYLGMQHTTTPHEIEDLDKFLSSVLESSQRDTIP